MNCETARILMETNDPGLARHLLSCPSCVVRTQARYYTAPPGLERKIRQGLRPERAAPKMQTPHRGVATTFTK